MSFVTALNTVLEDSVVTRAEWEKSVRAAFQEDLGKGNTGEIETGFKKFTEDKSRVLMPAVLADLRSMVSPDSSLQSLLNQVVQIGEDQTHVASDLDRTDANRNGLDRDELIAAFEGKEDQKAYPVQGIRYLRIKLGLERDLIRGGVTLFVASKLESRAFIYPEPLNYFAAGLEQKPAGLGINPKLIEEYRAAGIEEPKPPHSTERSERGGKSKKSGKSRKPGKTGRLDLLY